MYWEQLDRLLSPKFFEQFLENATAKRNQKKQELWDYTRDFALHGSPSYQPQGTPFGNGVVFGEDLAAQNAGLALAELGRAFLPGFQEKRRELRDARKALGQAAYAADMSAFFQLTPKEQNAIIDYKTARDNAMMLGGQQPGLGEALGQEVIRLHEVFGDRYDMKRIDELAETWGRYQNAQITEEIREMGQRQGQGDTATKALASGASILTKMAGDWTAPLGHLMDLASSTGRYGGFDENSLGSAFDVYTDSVRGAVAEDIRGDGQNGWRNAASYLYQNGMSAADILASIGLYKNYSNIVSGIGAFGDTITDASAKDASYGEALALAGADALITAGVNKLPFDALLGTASGAPKKALEIPGDILRQIGAQVGAGTLTNLGNEALERYILQEDSAYGQEIDFNMREGMSYEEAKQAADKAFWKRMADNALNRVVTGAFSSTGAMAYSYANKAYNDWRERAELSEIQTSQNEQIPQQGIGGVDELKDGEYNKTDQQSLEDGSQDNGNATVRDLGDYVIASPRFVNSNDDLYEYGKKVVPIPGYEDVIVHGDPVGFTFKDSNGDESNVAVYEFAEMLKESGLWHGGDIRLLSCNTAADGAIAAQGLANHLGVNVLAPSGYVCFYSDGEVYVSSDGVKKDGEWRLIKPKSKRGERP